MNKFNVNPFNYSYNEEFPREIVNEKNWTEHYFFQGYDFESQYGVCIHIGRLVDDPQIWRSTLQIYLPDQQLLTTILWGRDSHIFGPGAGPLKISCVEPFNLWTIAFDGVAQRVTREALMQDIIEDAPVEPIRFNLLFEAVGPLFGRKKEQAEAKAVGTFHTEQIVRMRGHFQHRGALFTVSGHGARDHSAGPRDYGPVIGDVWFQSHYENGDCLMVQVVRFDDGELRNSYYFDAASREVEMLDIIDHPFVATADTAQGSVARDPLADPSVRHFEFRLRRKDGRDLHVKGELVHSHAISYMSPMEELNGTLSDGRDGIQMCESPARVEMNGVPGWALRERALRVRCLQPSTSRRRHG